MNRPRLLTRILGFFPITALMFVVGIAIGVNWWNHRETVTDWAPIIAVFMIGMASNASTAMDRYTNWKRAWDNMEGKRPSPPLYGVKAFSLMLITLALGWMVLSQLTGTPPLFDPVAIGLLLLASVIFLYQLVQWKRYRLPSARKVKPTRAHIVSVCLPVPSSGPMPRADELPSYCKLLLNR